MRRCPAWLKEPRGRESRRAQAAEHCAKQGVDIAKLALQFSLANPDIATTIAGSANPNNIRNWAKWAAEPLDQQLLAEVQQSSRRSKTSATSKACRKNN